MEIYQAGHTFIVPVALTSCLSTVCMSPLLCLRFWSWQWRMTSPLPTTGTPEFCCILVVALEIVLELGRRDWGCLMGDWSVIEAAQGAFDACGIRFHVSSERLLTPTSGKANERPCVLPPVTWPPKCLRPHPESRTVMITVPYHEPDQLLSLLVTESHSITRSENET